MPTNPLSLVVLPARNESGTVREVVESVRTCIDCDVLVIDDASEDNTAEEARAGGATVLTMTFQVGAWPAAHTGLIYALRWGYNLVLTMDADGQHFASSLDAVQSPVLTGEVDVAIGVCPDRVSGARQFTWKALNFITGLNLQDITSGLRAYNMDSMRLLTSRNANMFKYQDVGVLLILRDAGMQVAEIRVEMATRRFGHSRVYYSWPAVFEYLLETSVISICKWRPSWHFKSLFVATSKSNEDKFE